VLARHSSVIARPAPLVRARLTHVNGAPVARRDLSGLTVEERARQRFLTREYNLTYKDELQDSERVIQGRFWAPGESGPQISLERSFARRVGVTLGDRLSFDVQGRPVEGVVSSLREVEWVSMRPNFFVVFPVRALEGAPQTFVTSVRAGDPARSSALRRELAGPYPNVSVIDLSKALDNVQSVLGALIGALELLAWFCLAVGLLVLAGTLGLERRERVRQAALYRALGASSRELLLMDLGEFLALGAAAVAIAGPADEPGRVLRPALARAHRGRRPAPAAERGPAHPRARPPRPAPLPAPRRRLIKA
jgi:putative ABC transport system permease protein